MPLLHSLITSKPVIDAIDVIEDAMVELVLAEDDITTIYPLIVRSVDIV